jgi:hypothetical protein
MAKGCLWWLTVSNPMRNYKTVRQKMKIGKLFLALLAILLIGGFAALIIIDVPVKQTEISREIPHDSFTE